MAVHSTKCSIDLDVQYSTSHRKPQQKNTDRWEDLNAHASSQDAQAHSGEAGEGGGGLRFHVATSLRHDFTTS